jgi:hypothetical protein
MKGRRSVVVNAEGEMWKLLVVWTALAVAVLIMYGPAVAMFVSR